jgi:hypothetical protein
MPGQTMFATVVVDGQLASIEQFGNIVLRANADGSAVRCATWRASNWARRPTPPRRA